MRVTTYVERSFRSRDPAETERWLAGHFGLVELCSSFRGYAEDVVGDERFVLADATMFGRLRCILDPEVVVVSAGTPGSHWAIGEQTGDFAAEPAVFQPRQTSVHSLADTQGRAVGFRVADLQRTARLLYANDDLQVRFDGGRAVGPRMSAYWLAALEIARSEREAGMLCNDMLRAATYRLLAVAALESFRLVGDRRDLHVSADRREKVYRLGSQYLRDHAALPITIDDAAEAAGASTGELVLAFRSHSLRDQGPTAYLRRSRLSGARDQLGDTSATVGDVARTWGFSSEATFIRQYRSEYGTEPVSSGGG